MARFIEYENFKKRICNKYDDEEIIEALYEVTICLVQLEEKIEKIKEIL